MKRVWKKILITIAVALGVMGSFGAQTVSAIPVQQTQLTDGGGGGGSSSSSSTTDGTEGTDSTSTSTTPTTTTTTTTTTSGSNCVNTNLFGCVPVDKNGGGIKRLLGLILRIFLYGIGVVAVIGVVIAGIMYLTARDNEQQLAKAKTRLIEVAIGLLVWAMLFTILQWLIPGFDTNMMEEFTNTSSSSTP